MSAPDRNTLPQENSTPSQGGPSVDAWIMKNLNDLREDMKSIRAAISSLDDRVVSAERKIMRFIYTVGGVVLTLALLWSAVQIASQFVDIKIVPKEVPRVEQPN